MLDTLPKHRGLGYAHPLRNRAVLGLPGVKVNQGRERLPENGERDPEDDVADQLAVGPLHLLQRRRDPNQGDLNEHA